MFSIKSVDKRERYLWIMNIMMLFIICQPFFDLLSFLYIRAYIPIGISTYAKPLIIGLINVYLLLVYRRHIVKCAITYGGYLILMIVHVFLMKDMLVETSVIFHEIRFMINLLYMLICIWNLRILYVEATNKTKFAEYLKTTLVITIILYLALFFVAVLSGTSGKTYEYSDGLKHGLKGWMDSGQIFGHCLCICLPFILSRFLNNDAKKKSVKIIVKILIVLPILTLCLIGTKVTYYIPILVLLCQVCIEAFFAIRCKKKEHILNSAICVICVGACLLAYPITPVNQNIIINNSVLSVQPDDSSLEIMVEHEKELFSFDFDQGSEDGLDFEEADVSDEGSEMVKYPRRYYKNAIWTERALAVLEQKYADGEVHPLDMRAKQLFFNYEKYKLADIEFKIFGLGYLNQSEMAIERDVLCVLFGFGVLGALLLLAYPIGLWFKSGFSILKRLSKTNMQTLCLFEGFSIFFFISWFAGYTFIYTNFSIFLVILMVLLNHEIKNTSGESK